MLNIYKFIALYLILMAYAYAAKAQEGNSADDKQSYDDYIITTKGDTIHCHISFPLLGGTPSYEIKSNQNKNLITTREIKEFYINDVDVLECSIPDPQSSKLEFMIWLERGKINMYAKASDYFSSDRVNLYFIKSSPQNEPPLRMLCDRYFGDVNEERQKAFNNLISDNETAYTIHREEDDFRLKWLRNMIRLYNTGKQIP